MMPNDISQSNVDKPIFRLGDKVIYSKIYKKSGFIKLDENDNSEGPVIFPCREEKEIPTRTGIVCGIRRLCVTCQADFFDAGNDEYSRDRWEVTPRSWKQVYLVAPNMAGLDRVDAAWMARA